MDTCNSGCQLVFAESEAFDRGAHYPPLLSFYFFAERFFVRACVSLWWGAGAGPAEGSTSAAVVWRTLSGILYLTIKGFEIIDRWNGSGSSAWEWVSFTESNKILQLSVLIAPLQLDKLLARKYTVSFLVGLPFDGVPLILDFLASCSSGMLLFSSVLLLKEIKELKCPCGWWNYHLDIWMPLCLWCWDILQALQSPPESTNRLWLLTVYMTYWQQCEEKFWLAMKDTAEVHFVLQYAWK